MKIEASAGRSKFDLRDHCERMVLRAASHDEAAFMAAFYRAVIFGGTITVRTERDGKETTIRFLDSVKSGASA